MKQIKLYLIIALLLLPISFAAQQTFSNTITISVVNYTTNQTENQTIVLNITTEENSHIYIINRNFTESFIFSLKRNVTECGEISSTLNNVTSSLSSLGATCDSIAKAYGDTNRYYELYAQCNTDKGRCDLNLQTTNNRLTEFTAYKSNYETCNTNLLDYQQRIFPIMYANATNLTNYANACVSALNDAESSKFIWAIIGAVLIGLFWAWEKRKQTPPTKRSKMLSGLN